MKKCLSVILLAIIFTSVNIHGEMPKISVLLQKLQDILEMKSDFKAKIVLTQQKIDQGVKVIEMMYYRKDSTDSFLIVMNAPELEKGNGYLRVGDNFWMYRRNTRTFQHITRDESIGGSDAKADDFEKRKLTELYEGAKDESGNEKIKETILGKIPVYEIEAKAKVNDVDYPKKKYWIKKDDNLLLKEESYSSSGTLMQTAFFLKYTIIDGRFVPIKHLYVDEFEKGNKTAVDISDISTNILDEKIFTKPYLENLSK